METAGEAQLRLEEDQQEAGQADEDGQQSGADQQRHLGRVGRGWAAGGRRGGQQAPPAPARHRRIIFVRLAGPGRRAAFLLAASVPVAAGPAEWHGLQGQRDVTVLSIGTESSPATWPATARLVLLVVLVVAGDDGHVVVAAAATRQSHPVDDPGQPLAHHRQVEQKERNAQQGVGRRQTFGQQSRRRVKSVPWKIQIQKIQKFKFSAKK